MRTQGLLELPVPGCCQPVTDTLCQSGCLFSPKHTRLLHHCYIYLGLPLERRSVFLPLYQISLPLSVWILLSVSVYQYTQLPSCSTSTLVDIHSGFETRYICVKSIPTWILMQDTPPNGPAFPVVMVDSKVTK